LQRVHNSAVHFMTRARKLEHISPVLKSLHFWSRGATEFANSIYQATNRCGHHRVSSYIGQ
jgi:hypothetical protein